MELFAIENDDERSRHEQEPSHVLEFLTLWSFEVQAPKAVLCDLNFFTLGLSACLDGCRVQSCDPDGSD
jgi:hypothetical protein